MEYDVSVREATHDELLQIVSCIEHKSKHELEVVLAEADKAGKGDLLRMKWRQDVEKRVAFERDQQMVSSTEINNYNTINVMFLTITGKRTNKWSTIKIRMGR